MRVGHGLELYVSNVVPVLRCTAPSPTVVILPPALSVSRHDSAFTGGNASNHEVGGRHELREDEGGEGSVEVAILLEDGADLVADMAVVVAKNKMGGGGRWSTNVRR